MTHILENTFLQIGLHADQASWDLYSRSSENLSIEGARVGFTYRIKRARFKALGRWEEVEVSGPAEILSPHGNLFQVSLGTGPDANGVRVRLYFALPEDHPIMLVKMIVENSGTRPIQAGRLELLKIGHSPGGNPGSPRHRSSINHLNSSPAFFSNGWGSWDYSAVYGPADKYRRTRLGPLTTPMRKHPGTPHPGERGHFSSDMFGVLGDRKSRCGLLAGFLSQKNQFGTLETWLQAPAPVLHMWANGDGARLDPGESMTSDWACLHFLDAGAGDPLLPYTLATARENGVELNVTSDASETIPTGWCSWYQFFSDVSEQDVRHNLEKLIELHHELPLKTVQIDDGFASMPGDWFDFKPSFPEGLAPLADKISQAGFTPGLWLAPFIVHPRSRLAREHPDWLVRGPLKRPANAGFSTWGTFTTGLDLTHPGALAYVQEVIHRAVHEWGYPYLKLDFLYAGALPGARHDPTRTLAQALRGGLEAIRETAGEKTMLLGCGCPLGPAIGLVDAMRIGPDVDGHWLPEMFGFRRILESEPGLPSTRNAIHNTLTRAFTHQRWWINDPDCLLLSPDTDLALAEIQSLATAIVMSGGSFLLSDDLPSLPVERLHIAQAMLPLIGKRPRVMDWFDSSTPHRVRLDLENASGAWHLLADFNWDDEARDIRLRLVDYDLDPGTVYLAREFWSGKTQRIMGGSAEFTNVPAHGVILLAVRECLPGQPQYMGGSLHISQGMEVAGWKTKADGLGLRIVRPGHAGGEVVLALPNPPAQVLLDEKPAIWRASDVEGCYHVQVRFDSEANLQVSWKTVFLKN
jgi:alpha-galactosidase